MSKIEITKIRFSQSVLIDGVEQVFLDETKKKGIIFDEDKGQFEIQEKLGGQSTFIFTTNVAWARGKRLPSEVDNQDKRRVAKKAE